MRLGVIVEQTANSFYRAIIPLRALEARGHTVIWPREGKDTPLSSLANCDLVHCYRRMDRIDDLRRLSARGVAISFDNDDNFPAAEVSDGGAGLRGHLHNRQLFKMVVATAHVADLVTTTNELLVEQFNAAGVTNVVTIDNHLERNMFGFGSKSKHDGVVIGWIAGREHALDLERVPVAQALERLLDTHPALRVVNVGTPLPIRSERLEYIPHVEYPDLLKVIGRIDIGLAPLADTQFNRSRSNVKLKEYGSGGAAWCASPVGPYSTLGESEGGLLVNDHEWHPVLDRLIRSGRLRKRLERRAIKWAKTQTIDRFVSQWENAFSAGIELAEQRRLVRSG